MRFHSVGRFGSLVLPAIFISIGVISSVAGETLTYPDLVRRLTDLDQLAAPAPEGENTALASSYDRARQYDAVNDKYINWGANNDSGGVIRKEGGKSVLAEIKGPGCIWRIWSAAADKGHVKIYLDGSDTPAVDLPFIGYFDGTSAPFNRPHIAYVMPTRGFDNYTPIPFQKSCRIVADPGWGAYYHFNYTTFAPGTVVPTFKLPLSEADNAALDQTEKILAHCGDDPAGTRPGQETTAVPVTVAAGGRATVADLSGAGAITALKVRFPLPPDPEKQKDFLRQLAIGITWDDDKAPAVWSPLGDFFGDALVFSKYQSLPMGITDAGQWYSYWYMPYASRARVVVQNDSGDPVTMQWEVTHAPLTKPIDSLLRFHAKWHRDAFLPQRADRFPDWTLLTTQGTGRYVGTQLHIWNPRGGWWGEGDEKWFVDGEKFPSSIGTGSEDYFGYAWGDPRYFSEPFHGQPVNEDNRGQVDDHRWHITDNIPFQKTFDGYIEKYQPNNLPTIYAAVAYWYLSPGGSDPYPEVPVAGRLGYWAPTLLKYQEPGAIEGESLRAIKGENTGVQGLVSGWSNDSQLMWGSRTPTGHAEYALPPRKAGKYKLIVRFTHAPDYGIVQLGINGVKAGGPNDLFDPIVKPADPVELGTVDLKEGDNVLDLDLAGKNPASASYLIGIDYLKLVPVP